MRAHTGLVQLTQETAEMARESVTLTCTQGWILMLVRVPEKRVQRLGLRTLLDDQPGLFNEEKETLLDECKCPWCWQISYVESMRRNPRSPQAMRHEE